MDVSSPFNTITLANLSHPSTSALALAFAAPPALPRRGRAHLRQALHIPQNGAAAYAQRLGQVVIGGGSPLRLDYRGLLTSLIVLLVLTFVVDVISTLARRAAR
jgi:hypothetical protein